MPGTLSGLCESQAPLTPQRLVHPRPPPRSSRGLSRLRTAAPPEVSRYSAGHLHTAPSLWLKMPLLPLSFQDTTLNMPLPLEPRPSTQTTGVLPLFSAPASLGAQISAFLLSTITTSPLPLSKESWLPWSLILSQCLSALHRGVRLTDTLPHQHSLLHAGVTSRQGTILLGTPNISMLPWSPPIPVSTPEGCSSSTSFESLLFPACGGGELGAGDPRCWWPSG